MSVFKIGDKSNFMIKILPEFKSDDEYTPVNLKRSFGKISIWINNINITSNIIDNVKSEFIGWYLSDFFTWIVDTWPLHFSNNVSPLVNREDSACEEYYTKFEEYFLEDDKKYEILQEWAEVHQISRAFSGALFPSLFMEKVNGRIEFSWANNIMIDEEQLLFEKEYGWEFVDIKYVKDVFSKLLDYVINEFVDVEDKPEWLKHIEEKHICL